MNQIILNDNGDKFILTPTTLRQVKNGYGHSPYTMSLKDVNLKAGTTQYRILWTPDTLALGRDYDRKKKYPTDFSIKKTLDGKFTHLEIGCQFFKLNMGRTIIRAVKALNAKTTKVGTFAKTKKKAVAA